MSTILPKIDTHPDCLVTVMNDKPHLVFSFIVLLAFYTSCEKKTYNILKIKQFRDMNGSCNEIFITPPVGSANMASLVKRKACIYSGELEKIKPKEKREKFLR